MRYAVLVCLLLVGCGTTAEVKKTLRALDRTALAAAKAERQIGDKAEVVLVGVAGVMTNLSGSTAAVNSILSGFEQRVPKTQERLDAALASITSLTDTVQDRVEDKKLRWLIYAIGGVVMFVLLHNVFTAHGAKKRIRALHADLSHVKSKLPGETK